MPKAVALISGGLDSLLATKLILEQGVEVRGVYFSSVFQSSKHSCESISKLITHQLQIPLKIFDVSLELLEIVKSPKYGYGKNLNPCIDCRILILQKAYQYMKEINASFLITGEVLGERPFSQRRETLALIERETNLEGLILRPLSAKLLKPTLAEEKGWVDRSRLLDIRGKSRKHQLSLAQKIGIRNYLTPAGGCLLTDIGFSQRMKDLFKYSPKVSLKDVELLKVGRHFRVSPQAKLVVARNEKECKTLGKLREEGDLVFSPQEGKGPLALGRGSFSQESLSLSAGILAYYTDKESSFLKISYRKAFSGELSLLEVPPLKSSLLDSLRI